MAKKKPSMVITQTLVTDSKITLSKEELVELIRMKYPEFPVGDCTIDVDYDDYHESCLNEITVQSTKSEKYNG